MSDPKADKAGQDPWEAGKPGEGKPGLPNPTPQDPLGHVLPSLPGRRRVLPGLPGGTDSLGTYVPRPPVFGDDWEAIRNLEKRNAFGADFVMVKKECSACGVACNMPVRRAFLMESAEIGWLCDDCRSKGFAWGSQIDGADFAQYQIVRMLKHDTLMRHLKYSLNHQEAQHKPIDIAELQARSLPIRRRKKYL